MATYQKIRTAVIPVAGKGRRMHPLTLVMPKEMLPTPNGPIIETIVRELIASGIEHIILVTAPGKELIEQHLAAVELPRLTSGDEVKLTYLQQDIRPGNGGAILTAADIIGAEPFLVVWGDELFLGEDHRAKQLIDSFSHTGKPTIALTPVDDQDVSKCGIADIKADLGDGLYELSALVEKPSLAEAPSRLASVGGYVLTPELVSLLSTTKPLKDGEVYLSTALDKFSKEGVLLGQVVSARWHETGSMSGYVKAFVSVTQQLPFR